jgi:hypothetical protein
MSEDIKFYVKLERSDIETSTLTALNTVLRNSGLATTEQRRVLQYLLDRRQPTVQPSGGES